MVTLAGFPAITPGTVSGVVVVVVVVTERVGAGGGGAETRCDSGAEAQPARRPKAPQNTRTGVSCLIVRTEAERYRKLLIFVFIFRHYTRIRSSTMGCYTKGATTRDPTNAKMVQNGIRVALWH